MTLRRMAVIALLLAGLVSAWWAMQPRPLEPLEYLPRDAPIVYCGQVDDPDAETPTPHSHWFKTLPVPPAPGGVFAKTMAPRVFRELGFLWGSRVCVAPIVPDITQIDEQGAAAFAVSEADRAVGRLLDRCTCTAIKSSRRLSRAPRCAKLENLEPAKCPHYETRVAQLDEALAQLDQALTEARPRLHWRLVGTLGKPGRFPVMAAKRLEWLDLSGQLSTPDDLAPGHEDDPLVKALLQVPNVTAVIRQGRGQAVLIAREIGDLQVLDYFEKLAPASRWGMDWTLLDGDILGARLESMLRLPSEGHSMKDQLDELPGQPSAWLADATGMVHLDHARLDDLERLHLAGRRITGFNYPQVDEKSEREELIADTLTLIWDAERTRGRLGLTVPGQAWWGNGQPGETIVQHVTALAKERGDYEFIPGAKHDFILRGTRLERGLFDALRGFPAVAESVFSLDAGALSGDAKAFELSLPQGRSGGEVKTAPGLQALQSYLSTRGHDLSVTVDAQAGFATFELRER